MKTILISFLFLVVPSHLLAENEIENPADQGQQELSIGDSSEKVKEVMGEPNGSMESGTFAIYYYKLGTVKMRSGKVSELNFISEQEWVDQQEAQRKAQEARRIEGEEIVKTMKEDPDFAALPAKNRLEFWEQFRRDFPDVNVYVLYSQAKIEAENIAETERKERQVVALERRLETAEAEVRRAAQELETQRIFELTRSNNYLTPQVIAYSTPYIIRKNRNCRTPYTRKRLTVSDKGVKVSVGGRSRRVTTSSSTSRFITSPRNVMDIQTSEGFKRDFY